MLFVSPTQLALLAVTTMKKFVFLLVSLTVVSIGSILVVQRHHPAQPDSRAAHHHRADERVSGARGAFDFWTAQRAYPNKTLPTRGHYDAYVYSKASLGADWEKGGAERPGAKEPWQELGPHNIGGRTLAIALNPQNPLTVYAGAASGGLWRSYTGGVGAAAWHYVSTGHPVLGVSTIAIDPGDSNTVYIGTGEVYSYYDTQGGITVRHTRGSYGMGILKTTDGGMTWTKSLDWSYQQQRGIWAVRINPLNPHTVWAGTTEGTYKSTDSGASWTQVDDTIMVMDLVIDPGDTSRVFIACGDMQSPGTGIYRTTDGGGSWSLMSQTGVIPAGWDGKAQLAVGASLPGVVYASIGNGDVGSYWTRLVRTLDGGNTWQLRSNVDYSRWQGWFAHDVAVAHDDVNQVMAAGIDIWKSTAGGNSLNQKSEWSLWYFGQTEPGGPEGPPNYSHADHHDIVFHPTDSDIIYFANDGGVFRSLAGGETFSGCNGGYQSQQFYAGFSSSQRDSHLALGGMQDNSTAIYFGTNAWFRAIGGDGSCTAIDPNNDSYLYGSAQYLQMFKSFDSGDSWFSVEPPSNLIGEPGFIAPFATGTGLLGGETIYAAGSKVAKSTNGGFNWNGTNGGLALDGNPAIALEVSRNDANIVYVTTAPVYSHAGVFVTTDGGATFADITGSLPDRYPVGLAIDPDDDQTAYVTFSGFGTSHVFRTTDGGGSWQDIGAALPDVPTSSVIVDPRQSDHVYVGNDIGVYYTDDGGANWYEYSTGLPDAVVAMDLTISPTSRHLRVSTYGNGVYERDLVYQVVAVDEQPPAVVSARLEQNQPNPFNAATTIRYHLSRETPVTLNIHDAAGRLVRCLVQERQPAGSYEFRWNGRDAADREVASGVYVYELKAGTHTETRKMTLLK